MSTGLSVSGNQLQLDGQRFTPKGMVLIGSQFYPLYRNWTLNLAHSQWMGNEQERTALKSWGVNTLICVVSQRILAGPNAADYIKSVKAFVDKAAGYVVILRMDDGWQEPYGYYPDGGFMGDETVNAWMNLAPAFADYPNVGYESYNEPKQEPTTDGWADWTKWQQAIITAIRQFAPAKPIFVQGCHKAMTWAGYPSTLTDTSLVYCTHPYSFVSGYYNTSTSSVAWWDQHYAPTRGHSVPVLMSELSVTPKQELVAPLQAFLNYLKPRSFGFTGWNFDGIDNEQLVLKELQDPATGKTWGQWGWTPTDTGAPIRDYFNS